MPCTYVKEFSFGGSVKAPVCQLKQGNKPRQQAPSGKPTVKLKKGGKVVEKATGEVYPSKSAMVKHESLETPLQQKEELIQKVAVKGRRGVPVAPTSPLLALRAARGL